MKRVLIYGDSNTYGYDPRDFYGGRYPSKDRWTTILQERLKDTHRLIVDGMNGRQIPDFSRDQGYLEQLIHKNQPLDLFACMLGTNDLLMTSRPDASVPAAKMERFVDWLEEQKAVSDILLIAPPFAGAGGDEYFEKYRKESQRMNRAFEEIAGRHHALFADASLWNIELAYDQVHFSLKGCADFAEHMAEVLAR